MTLQHDQRQSAHKTFHKTLQRPPALLVLSDGEVFEGYCGGSLLDEGGASQIVTGEIVFNTALSGYLEVATDPSYAGQVVLFTYPHIGNYGVSLDDRESEKPHCRAIVTRALPVRPSNWRSEIDFESYLKDNGVPIITGVDTRRLTRHLAAVGSLNCAIGRASESVLTQAAKQEPGTLLQDFVKDVTTPKRYMYVANSGSSKSKIAALDCGMKQSILKDLAKIGDVIVLPASTTAEEILDLGVKGLFLSNGPGDPEALGHIATTVDALVGKLPIMGICLGHQLLATALGAKTYKMAFGHHGVNHPVKRLSDNQIEITSQNHNYAVAADKLPGVSFTHINLNDNVIEGLAVEKANAISVQYHPEAAPGPHDSKYVFDRFKAMVNN